MDGSWRPSQVARGDEPGASFKEMHLWLGTPRSRALEILAIGLLTVTPLACDRSGKSEDEDIARCDRIAEGYVKYFADESSHGSTRKAFLAECVLGPEKSDTAREQDWVTCLDASVSAGEMANCQTAFSYWLKMDKLKELEVAVDETCTLWSASTSRRASGKRSRQR